MDQSNGSDVSLDDARFDPFRRQDSYGEIGTKRLPLHRRIFFALRSVVLLPIRGTVALTDTVAMRLACLFVNQLGAGWLLGPAINVCANICLLACGFWSIEFRDHQRPRQKGQRSTASSSVNFARGQTPLVISNHVSYLDILLLQKYYGAAYVTRQETRNTPLIGGICDTLPCIYVDRNKHSASGKGSTTTERIAKRVQAKLANPRLTTRPLAIFPEGTTTNGKYLLPFHTGAFVPGVPVQPVLISYPQIRGNPSVAWETMSAPRHMLLLLTSFLHRARMHALPVYIPSAEEREDPALYARNVRKYMKEVQLEWSDKLGMPLEASESSYPDKKEYHRRLREKHGLPVR